MKLKEGTTRRKIKGLDDTEARPKKPPPPHNPPYHRGHMSTHITGEMKHVLFLTVGNVCLECTLDDDENLESVALRLDENCVGKELWRR